MAWDDVASQTVLGAAKLTLIPNGVEIKKLKITAFVCCREQSKQKLFQC